MTKLGYIDVARVACSGSRCQRVTSRLIQVCLTAAGAAVLAACVIYALDGSNDQKTVLSAAPDSIGPQFETQIASPSRASSNHPAGLQSDAVVSVSAETSAVLFADGPFANWNALITREERQANSQKQLPAQTAESERTQSSSGASQASISEDVPLPRIRPSGSERQTQPLRATAASSAPSTTAVDKPFGIFEKFFALARPEPPSPPEAKDRTAVYDISARTLFMPNGERIEAHSGLGSFLDDPSHVTERAKGPTPPNTYRLSLRESLFHGVQAIRMSPVDAGRMYGRAGILAHPYMLGGDGASNGCVSIQNYPKFLEAFQKGEIERLVVVSGVNTAPADLQAHRGTEDKQAAAF